MKQIDTLKEAMVYNRENPSSTRVYEDELLKGIRGYALSCAMTGCGSAFVDRDAFTNRMIDQLEKEGYNIIYNMDRNMLELIWE